MLEDPVSRLNDRSSTSVTESRRVSLASSVAAHASLLRDLRTLTHVLGKTLSTCLFERCSHQEVGPILHSLSHSRLAVLFILDTKLDTTFLVSLWPGLTAVQQRKT